MSDALARVFAIQQREINENERARQIAIAKREREINAFMNSGLPAMYTEFADVPLKADAQQRLYKKTFAECTFSHCDPRSKRVSEMTMTSIGSSGSGPRWWCKEDPDSGQMRYYYSEIGSYSGFTVSEREPTGKWLDAFVEYIAKLCDPVVVARRLSESQEQGLQERVNRRQLQPI